MTVAVRRADGADGSDTATDYGCLGLRERCRQVVVAEPLSMLQGGYTIAIG